MAVSIFLFPSLHLFPSLDSLFIVIILSGHGCSLLRWTTYNLYLVPVPNFGSCFSVVFNGMETKKLPIRSNKKVIKRKKKKKGMERSFLSDQTLQDTHFLIKDFGMERSNSLHAHFSTSHQTLQDTHFLSKKHLHLKSLHFWPPFLEAHFLEILRNSISIDQRAFYPWVPLFSVFWPWHCSR